MGNETVDCPITGTKVRKKERCPGEICGSCSWTQGKPGIEKQKAQKKPSRKISFIRTQPPNKVEPDKAPGLLALAKESLCLNPGDRLWALLALFKDNFQCDHGFSPEQIFQAAYDDSSGNDYWRGWLEQPGLTIAQFVHLLSVHKTAEQGFLCRKAGKDCHTDCQIPSISLSTENQDLDPFQPLLSSFVSIETCSEYVAHREKLLGLLRIAAEMTTLQFKGDTAALLKYAKGREIFYDRHDRKVKTLSDAKVNPRETILWLAGAPERAYLLPGSLQAWCQRLLGKGEAREATDQEERQEEYRSLDGGKRLKGYHRIARPFGYKPETVKKTWRKQGAPILKDDKGRVYAFENDMWQWFDDKGKKLKKSE